MTEQLTFHKAYPAPWRIQRDDVLDADGDVIVTFDEEADTSFWQGIVDAVNSQGRLESALRLARAL